MALAKPNLQHALRELFKMHCASGTESGLDLTRFLAAQAALSKLHGLAFSPMSATSVFCDLNELRWRQKGTELCDVFQAFMKWQLQQFVHAGFDMDQASEALRSALPAVQLQVQSTASEEKTRDARIRGIRAKPLGVEVAVKELGQQQRPKKEAPGQLRPRADTEPQDWQALSRPEEKKREGERRRGENELQENADDCSPAVANQLKPPTQPFSQGPGQRRAAKQKVNEWTPPASLKAEQAMEDYKAQHGSSSASLGFKLVSLAITSKAKSVPPQDCNSIQSLARHLANLGTSEEEKAWATFVWICHHISYDVDGFRGQRPRKSCNPEDVLQSRLCVCQGYANLFEAIAKATGLEAKIITGRTKEGGAGGHAWNAVKLRGRWMLLDCTWGGGAVDQKFTRRFEPFFFGVPPPHLLFSHFPSQEDEQFMDVQMPQSQFDSQPNVTARFFSAGLAFPSDNVCGLLTCKRHNQGNIALIVPSRVGLLATLDGQEELCFVERSGSSERVQVHFACRRVGQGQHKLDISASAPGSGTYYKVCSFDVASSPGRFEPCFPKVWMAKFQEYALKFSVVPPSGLLEPEQGLVALPILVPAKTKLLVKLGQTELRQRGTSSNGVTCIIPPSAQPAEAITVYANNPGSSSAGVFDAVARFKYKHSG